MTVNYHRYSITFNIFENFPKIEISAAVFFYCRDTSYEIKRQRVTGEKMTMNAAEFS